MSSGSTRLAAYVGSYGAAPGALGGGVFAFEVSPDGRLLRAIDHAPEPVEAGYMTFAADTGTLYVLDERKNDGRGPVHPPAAVHSLRVDRTTGGLRWLNAQSTPGPRPNYVDYRNGRLVTSNHGDFEHVEKVVRTADGGWGVEYFYDDSTVILFEVEPDGQIGSILDLQVLEGHGKDPNFSLQAGGHCQASPHAHSAVIDPTGRFVLVGEKGTDRILVYSMADSLVLASVCTFEPESAPRHLAFDPSSGLAVANMELSSQLVSMRFDADQGELTVLHSISTLRPDYQGPNEPAEVRVHPAGGFVYVNNRGEDTLAWFTMDSNGKFERSGDVPLAKSIHPGLAARSFAIDPSGTFLLATDRPANLLRSYAIHPIDGSLSPLAEVEVPDPVCVTFAPLAPSA